MLDEITITVIGGHGGNGAVSFRRGGYVPRGGPDGGAGGRGGDVIVEADSSLRVLESLRRLRMIRAEAGVNGGSAKKQGRRGSNVIAKVPVGTIIWEAGSGGRQLVDLSRPGMRAVVARGGAGGGGGAAVATATRRTPRLAERGLPGEERKLRLA